VDVDSRVGTILAEYRIESVLGRGGMGVVYLAEHIRLRRKVALKVLTPDLASDARFRDRFVRESRIAASLEHPNIVPVYEAAEAGNELFLAMRYIRGNDLKTVIKQDGPLGPDRVLPLLAQIASALDAAHAEGLVHRDVKPGNVLVASPSDPDEPEVAYLTDFGLTKRVTSESGMTATGQFVGTFDYAAPEQFEGKSLDARTDVYSLAAVLYECLSGEVPYPREQDVALMFAHMSAPAPKVTTNRPELPKAIDDVIATGMAKMPDERFRSAGELVRTARGVLGGEEVDLPEIRAWKRRRRWLALRRRRRLFVGVTAAVLAATVAVVAIVVTSGGGTRRLTVAPATLIRIDPRTSRVVGQPIRVGAGGGPVAVGGDSVWVADTRADQIVRIDPTGAVAPTQIPVGSDPVSMVASDEQNRIYVATSAKILGIDMDSNAAGATRLLPGIPTSLSFGNGSVWISALSSVGPSRGLLLQLDPVSLLQTQTTLGEPGTVAVGAGSVWIMESRGGGPGAPGPALLTRFDPKTKKPIATTELPQAGVDIEVANGSVWAVDGTGTVYRIDPEKNKVAQTYPTRVKATDMAVGEGAVWVLSRFEAALVRVDLATGKVSAPIRVGGDPLSIASGGGSVWVVRTGG
jgi:streptogramin lyase